MVCTKNYNITPINIAENMWFFYLIIISYINYIIPSPLILLNETHGVLYYVYKKYDNIIMNMIFAQFPKSKPFQTVYVYMVLWFPGLQFTDLSHVHPYYVHTSNAYVL